MDENGVPIQSLRLQTAMLVHPVPGRVAIAPYS